MEWVIIFYWGKWRRLAGCMYRVGGFFVKALGSKGLAFFGVVIVFGFCLR